MFKYCGSQRLCRCGQVSFLLLMAAISCEKAIGQTNSEESKKEAATREVRNAVDVPAAWSSRYRFNVSLLPGAARLVEASRFRMGSASGSAHLSTYAGIGRGALVFRGSSFAIKGGDPTWKGGPGNWSVAANWNGGVPTATTDASIDGGNPVVSPVTLDIGGAQVRNLTIDSDDSLNFNNGTSLTVNGSSVSNAGKITLNSTGSSTELIIANTALTLSGGGSLTMSNNANNIIIGNATTDTLTNQSTIQGSGNIGGGRMTLSNSGTINANQPTPLTIQANGGVTNTGTMEATNGILAFSGDTVTNTTGKISASNSTLQVINSTLNGGTVTLTGASALQLSNGTVQSGTLTNSSTGVIESLSNTTNTLGGAITNPVGGVVQVDNNSTLNLLGGTYTNSGTTEVNSGGNFTILKVNGSAVTATGGGTIALSNNANNIIEGAASTDILTNQETIQGSGNIGNGIMGLVNSSSGNIIANHNIPLIINTSSSGFNNQGTLTVNAADVLQITTNTPFQNFSGTTLTGGAYNVSGTMQFGAAGTRLVTNAANITLTGSAAQIIDFNNENVLTGFATNATGASFALAGGANFTTAGNFTNNGTLTVGSGSTFKVNGNLTNFSGTTLTGGTYNLTGTLQFNGANVVTNSANITLSGATSQILNQTSGNGLANFATNSSSGVFSLGGGRTLTTAGSFTNAGSMVIGSGSMLTVGGTGTTYTQTGGSTLDDGSLALSGTGLLALNAGTLFGIGSVTGAVKSSGTVSPGNAASSPGVLKETGAYTQNSGGTLAISVGGTTVGTQFDQFNPSTATLGGALTTTLINGFTPTVGQTFTIMNFTSRTGTFASCDGRSGGTTCPINSTEHFNITYNANSVVLTVASGAAVVGVPPISHVAMGLKPSASALLTTISTYGSRLGIKSTELAALGAAVHYDRLSGVAAFRMRNSAGGPAIIRFTGPTGTSAASARLDSIGAMQRSRIHASKMVAPRTVEYNLNLLPLFGTSPKRAFGSGVSFGSIDTH